MRYPTHLAVLACVLTSVATALAQATPPVQPKVVETPLPPAVELPGPELLAPDLPPGPIRAADAARLALRHQPLILAATAGLQSAEAQSQQARSAIRPSVSVGGNFTDLVLETGGTRSVGASSTSSEVNLAAVSVPRVTIARSGSQVSATVSRLFYDSGHTRHVVRQAVAGERSAAADLTRVRSDVVLWVKQAFYQYLQAVRLIGVAEQNLRNQDYHLALAQARLNSGLGLPLDVSRAQAARAQAIYDLSAARNTAAQARVSLAELIGLDPRTPIEPADSYEPVVEPTDLAEVTQQALRQRPEMIQAQANLDAARFALNAARTFNSPAVVGSLSLAHQHIKSSPSGQQLGVGVGVQWAPFDGGFTAGLVKDARAASQRVQSEMDSTRLAVVADVSAAYLNLKTAEQRVSTAQTEIYNAEEAVRLAQGRYQTGVGLFLDILDAQATLDQARANHVNAISAVDQARAALAHAVGTPPPEP
jgi:outer membrane protein TolC